LQLLLSSVFHPDLSRFYLVSR